MKSLVRYERHALLASVWAKFTAVQKAHFEACEKAVAGVLLHGRRGSALGA